jgi:hypothetical protein
VAALRHQAAPSHRLTNPHRAKTQAKMRARIVERRAPLVGTPLIYGGAAGAADIHFIHLDLDERPALGAHAELDDTMQ